MMSKLNIFLVLVLSVCALGQKANNTLNAPAIAGTWKNELGSTMVIKQKGRNLVGKYCTAVSRYPLKRPTFDLVGLVGLGTPTSIGWVVTYTSKDKISTSTAAWSGQYRLKAGKQVILTTWTLTAPAKKENAIWASTNIGQDNFHRVKPDQTCKF
ncbi:streptavidin-V2-like isoform X1 [Hydractinia symbiolongicarpus]|uniref:streptavidin-V2-like n=1 Tax=Hydractinia symbiolongicarpus TaxID=13093 RepID=UPI00254DB8CC|nr:streptavidin-V2-like [Hydractinia symbiolongicarpus]XP_057308430.1 streptavidin-V2-like isoform X1 [Hydractinia symbiolongicarpus]